MSFFKKKQPPAPCQNQQDRDALNRTLDNADSRLAEVLKRLKDKCNEKERTQNAHAGHA